MNRLTLSCAALLAALCLAGPAQAQTFGAQVSLGSGILGGAGSLSAGGSRVVPVRDGLVAASADLKSGSLHAFVDSGRAIPKGACDPRRDNDCNWWRSAEASLWERLVFQADELATPGEIKWKFAFSGSDQTGPLAGGANGYGLAYVGTDPNRSRVGQYLQIHDGDVWSGSLAMTGSSMVVYFSASLWAAGSRGGVADYSHTMRFSWELPPGVTRRHPSQ